VYLLATTAYSIWLRRLFLIDVAALSAFYTLRIIAGGYASDMSVSGWLIAFSVVLFGSLALAKRSAELQGLSASDADVSRGRAYRADHRSLLKKLGRSAAVASVIVFWLYLVGDAASELYPNGWLLWLILPILCLWLFRLWWLVESGSLSDDPLMYAIKDRGSLALIIASAILVITAAIPFS
jgi:4-hydroxybenzoate polyprenyltransferase